MRPYILSESHWSDVSDQEFDLAILPWGATEAHNFHLPYGTDNYETDALVFEAARMAWEQGAKVIVLPTIPMGVNTGQSDIYMTMNMNPSTQQSILEDVVESLDGYGVDKLLVVNGHGGNDFRQIIREVGSNFPDMLIATCNWFQSVDQDRIFENDGGHADEMETSLMLYARPELVKPLAEAGEGKARKFRVEALNESWAWTERKWTQCTDDTGIGDPRKATLEKGERYFREVTEKLSGLFVSMAKTSEGDLYI
ncbi:MAG: creatininase family protein [Bacteroidales bacterium]|nr:creatininase family protein [Bacteroidales bacterium]